MRGQYSTHCGHRPRPREAAPDEAPGRLFLCVRCRAQALICSCCDRGQIYCGGGCAQEARHHGQLAAGRRYQTSRRGRLSHAERARRYRAQQKNVTHQGSPLSAPDDLVAVDTTATASKSPAAASGDVTTRSRGRGAATWRCHWCGCRCPPFVRTGFLPRRRRGSRRGRTSRRGP